MISKRIAAAPVNTRPVVRQKVHIRITYAGTGAPTRVLHGKFLQFEAGMLHEDSGTIEKSSLGGGAMDIYVSTTAAQSTSEMAWRLANQLGISANTTVKTVRRETED